LEEYKLNKSLKKIYDDYYLKIKEKIHKYA
jgi:hypothetical protein